MDGENRGPKDLTHPQRLCNYGAGGHWCHWCHWFFAKRSTFRGSIGWSTPLRPIGWSLYSTAPCVSPIVRVLVLRGSHIGWVKIAVRKRCVFGPPSSMNLGGKKICHTYNIYQYLIYKYIWYIYIYIILIGTPQMRIGAKSVPGDHIDSRRSTCRWLRQKAPDPSRLEPGGLGMELIPHWRDSWNEQSPIILKGQRVCQTGIVSKNRDW